MGKDDIHRSSAEVLATLLYSTSVEDLATPFCFFDAHEKGCCPRNMMYLLVETYDVSIS